MQANSETKVKGTITEAHESEIADVFGKDMAAMVADAPEGTTFLDLLVKAGRI